MSSLNFTPPETSLEGFSGGSKGAAAAAKSFQSYPTLCDPIDGSPPGSPVPGILAPMNPANNEEQTDNVKFLSTVEKKNKNKKQ